MKNKRLKLCDYKTHLALTVLPFLRKSKKQILLYLKHTGGSQKSEKSLQFRSRGKFPLVVTPHLTQVSRAFHNKCVITFEFLEHIIFNSPEKWNEISSVRLY